MNKYFILSILVGAILLFFYWYRVSLSSSPENLSSNFQAQTNLTVQKAQELYQTQKEEGTDFSSGPCLTNDLQPGWVADIAHNPREPVDNLPENQCSGFREGNTHHFVELDPEGNFIRAK